MTFLELAERVLREMKKPLTANEIWQSGIDKGYDKQLNSLGKTPRATLGAQIYVNTKDNPKSPFAQTDSRPKKFDFKEEELHKFLTYYAYYHLNCYTKTINHSQSTKKEYGQWVHPDMVGCYFPLDEWKPEVYELSSSIGNISIKLFSFELKRELTFGNLRESFFQAVSNSSWANESYLVAADISNEQEFMDELTRLSSAFGIGVIKLNLEDPHSSEIVLTAKYREALDWDTINKLVTMNSDFKEFILTVKIDVTSKKIHKKEYNLVLDVETLRRKVIA